MVVLDRFMMWIQISPLKARRDSALATIVPGLSPPFNGLKNVDGFDDFGCVFLIINLRCGLIVVPAEPQPIINKDSVGSSTVFSQSSVVGIIGNQALPRAGGFQHSLHEWEKITSDPFILDAVTHFNLEFGWIPEALSGATRPYHSVTETEKTVIDKEVLNFLLKGIARLYLYEDVLVIFPILYDLKRTVLTWVIFEEAK